MTPPPTIKHRRVRNWWPPRIFYQKGGVDRTHRPLPPYASDTSPRPQRKVTSPLNKFTTYIVLSVSESSRGSHICGLYRLSVVHIPRLVFNTKTGRFPNFSHFLPDGFPILVNFGVQMNKNRHKIAKYGNCTKEHNILVGKNVSR